MDVRVRYLGGKKFEMTARDHSILADQPFDDDGTNTAMTPPELFLSALGACAAYYAAEYLRARALPVDQLEVRISGLKGDKPARIVSLTLDIIDPGLTERHREGILRAVNYCLLKNTLHVPPDINVRVNALTPVAVEEPALV